LTRQLSTGGRLIQGRGVEQWQLARLITWRSWVQIPSPQFQEYANQVRHLFPPILEKPVAFLVRRRARSATLLDTPVASTATAQGYRQARASHAQQIAESPSGGLRWRFGAGFAAAQASCLLIFPEQQWERLLLPASRRQRLRFPPDRAALECSCGTVRTEPAPYRVPRFE
jgi:hypothetical protein